MKQLTPKAFADYLAEAAEKIRQDSLKSAMSIQDKPAETQTEVKTDEEPTALIAKRD